MEKKYLKPTCSLISVKEECYLLNTSRYGDVGNHENTNPNIGKEHYGDPTGPIEKKDCNVLELVDNFGFLISFFFDKFIC